jgi:hypothetical protein
MKTYSVWIDIEEFDPDTNRSQNLEAPGPAVSSFATYQEAWLFAERLYAQGLALIAMNPERPH